MRVFDDKKDSGKVNFVDDNNVLVGYDIYQSCCEDAGWFFSFDASEPYSYDKDYGLGDYQKRKGKDKYSFDPEYFDYVQSRDLDCGEQVCFRLIAEGEPDVFLHLYNAHNGWYGHGFTVSIDGEVIKDECL